VDGNLHRLVRLTAADQRRRDDHRAGAAGLLAEPGNVDRDRLRSVLPCGPDGRPRQARPAGAILASIAVIALAVLATPLHGIVSQRLQNGDSNHLRASLSVIAVKDAQASPVLGYGDTRQETGSPSSITVGPTNNCANCARTRSAATASYGCC
jgi:hypothetical protein